MHNEFSFTFSSLFLLRTPILFPDPGCNHGQGEGAKKDAAHDAWWDMHKLPKDQLNANEDEDCCDPVLEKLEELHELIHNEEHRSKTEHCKDSRGVCQEEVWDLSDNCANRVDGEQDVADFEADHNKEEHGSTPFCTDPTVCPPDSPKVNSAIAALALLVVCSFHASVRHCVGRDERLTMFDWNLYEEASFAVVVAHERQTTGQELDHCIFGRVLFIVVSKHTLNTCVNEEATKEDVSKHHGMQHHLANEQEDEAEEDRTANAQEQWPVFLVIRSTIDLEDEVENEYVVKRQHPLQKITTAPVEGLVGTEPPVDVPAKDACHQNPEKGVGSCDTDSESLVAPVKHEVVEDDQHHEDNGEGHPCRSILASEQGVHAIALIRCLLHVPKAFSQGQHHVIILLLNCDQRRLVGCVLHYTDRLSPVTFALLALKVLDPLKVDL